MADNSNYIHPVSRDNEGASSLGERAILCEKEIIEGDFEHVVLALDSLSAAFVERLNQSDLIDAGMEQRREVLLHFFYYEWGFQADKDHYFLAQSALISEVLASRCGGPVLLGLLLLHLAKLGGISLYGVDFPGHFLLSYDLTQGERIYFDPYSQESLSWAQLQARVRGTISSLTLLAPEKHLVIVTDDELITRLISVKKAAFIRAKQHLHALRCNELLLAGDPTNPYEIRDRGFLFEQLNCHRVAVSDYQYFISKCPDDPVVPLLKLQSKVLGDKEIQFH